MPADNPVIPATPGSECAFPACDCPGDTPVCDDYELAGRQRLGRILQGRSCPIHDVAEPCPTCEAHITGQPLKPRSESDPSPSAW